MIDAIIMAVLGSGTTLAGFLVGRRTRPTPAPSYTCACGHLLTSHDLPGNTCLAEAERKKYDVTGQYGGTEYVRCTCTRYIGDLPAEILAERWAPPLPE